MILLATRSLLTSEFVMLLVPICKTAVSLITFVSLKVGKIQWRKCFAVALSEKQQLQLAL